MISHPPIGNARPCRSPHGERSFAAESGFGLIEVMISAAILVVVAAGVLVSFSAATHLTSEQQRRSAGQALAQQDEDRLRGMSITELSSSIPQAPNVTLNGAVFRVTSTAQWQNAATGGSSCTANGQASYIQTTSQVSWTAANNTGATHFISASSIITPQAGGELIVEVVNSQGSGVQNMSVSATGPTNDGPGTNYTATTASNGCAILAGLPGGTYNVTVSQPGYVDPSGNTSPPPSQQGYTVIEGESVTASFQYDQAGTIRTSFTGANSTAGDTMLIVNNNIPRPGYRAFGTLGSYVSSLTATNVFPFPSQYTVYAGSCPADEPATYGGTDQTALVPPAGSAQPVLQLPSMNVTVYSGTASVPGPPLANTSVVIKDTGCSVTRTFTTNSSGQAKVSLPYGLYNVCAAKRVFSITFSYSASVTNNVLGGAAVNLYLGSANIQSPCPT